MSQFTLSAFGDEIAIDLESQLQTLNDLQVPGLDCRTAWGTNVLYFSDEEAQRVKRLCDEAGVFVSCIGSPIGKSPLTDPIENEEKNLRRIIEIARLLGTERVRIFSFYPPDMSSNDHYDQHVPEVTERLGRLTLIAQEAGVTLLHENEKHIIGDTPERNHALLRGVNNPHLRGIWDPANYVQVGVERLTERYWSLLAPYTAYVHIKDALLVDGSVKPAGQGDGQIPELLAELRDSGYAGILSLEPHLAVAGHSSGFSGVEGMTLAVNALRGLIDTL